MPADVELMDKLARTLETEESIILTLDEGEVSILTARHPYLLPVDIGTGPNLRTAIAAIKEPKEAKEKRNAK